MIPKSVLEKYQIPIDDINILIKTCNKQLAKSFNIEEKSLYSYSLFFKIANGYKASIKLLKEGLVIEAGYVVRTIMEANFVLKYMSIDMNDAVFRLKENLDIEQNKIKRRIQNNPAYIKLLEHVRKEGRDLSYNNNDKQKSTTINKWAKLAEQENIYVMAYNSLCTDSHTNIKSIEKNIKVIDGCVSFVNANEFEDYDNIIIVMLYIMTSTIESIGKIFNLKNKKTLDKLQLIIDHVTQASTINKNKTK